MKLPRSRPEAGRRLCGAVLISLPALTPSVWAADVAGFGVAGAGVAGTSVAGAGGTTIQSRLTLQTLVTDNVAMVAGERDAGVVMTVSPGITMSSRAGLITGKLDYALSGIAYFGGGQPDRLQQSLNATGSAELIQHVLKVDVTALISQVSNSALGAQTVDTSLASTNRTEVSTLSVSPTLQGHVGSFASFVIRATATDSRSRHSTLGDARQIGGSAVLTGLSGGKLNWSANLVSQSTNFQGTTSAGNDDQAWLGLSYQYDVDLSASLHGGVERSNYQIGTNQTSSIYGGSVNWVPSPRVRASGEWMHHVYGDTHSVNVEYRLARSALRYVDTQTASQVPQLSATSLGSAYDVLFLQYASIEPDPVKRDQLVRAFLSANGISPDAQINRAFLTNAPTLARSQQLSYSASGVRTTLIFSLQRSVTGRLGVSSIYGGDLGRFSSVTQGGVSGSLSHQLTPISNVGISLSWFRNNGNGGNSALGNSVQMRTATASWSTQLARRTSLGVSLRHAQSQGATGYQENAALVNLVQLF